VLTVRGSVRKDSVDVPGIVCVDDSLGRFHLGIEAESVRDTVRARVGAVFLDRFLPGMGDDIAVDVIAVDVYVCPYARTSRGELAAVSLLALRSRSSRNGSGTMHAS
jgi:hypothetical protein